MRTYKPALYILIIGLAAFQSCYKLQSDYKRDPQPLDPHIYKSAWQYLKDRSVANNTDTVFRVMYNAIIYSGMDSNEYMQPNRTFIFMTNTAAKAVWSNVKTAANASAKNWSDYSKADVKTYLQYLILDGVYDHYTLPAIDVDTVRTLAPVGAYTTVPNGFKIPNFISNPQSKMTIQVINSSPSNTSDYPIQLNGNLNVATSSILATNGTIHVINGFLNTNLPQ